MPHRRSPAPEIARESAGPGRRPGPVLRARTTSPGGSPSRIPGLTLQLYILRQLVLSLAFALAGIAVLVVPSAAIQAIHRLQGGSLLALLDYMPLVLVDLVPYVLPMAFLLGVVATFGRLAADKELIASAMAGMHPARTLLPGLLVAVLFALLTNWMLGYVSPDLKFQTRDFVRAAQSDSFRATLAGRTEMDLERFFLKAKSAEGLRKLDVILNYSPKGGPSVRVRAREVSLDIGEDCLTMHLKGAQSLNEGSEIESESPSFRVPWDELFPPEPKPRNRAKYFTTSELREVIAGKGLNRGRQRDAVQRIHRNHAPSALCLLFRTTQLAAATEGDRVDAENRRREFIFEIHRRQALSASCILFLLLGVPTGIMLRSGTQLGAFTGAMGYAFLYYVLAFRLGKTLAGWDVLPPVFAAWSTNLLFLAMGIVLSYRTLWR